MARRRGRRMAMAAAGLATAATPLLFGEHVAGAAVTRASGSDRQSMLTNSGQAIECSATIFGEHNTDDANQPTLSWGTALFGDNPCFEDFSVRLTATYKDSEGVTRTLTYSVANQGPAGSVTGAYTATSVRADVHYFNCDASQSADCDVTAIASPK